MRIIETTVYTFAELSEEAKQKAIENCRETEFYWSGEIMESLKEGLDSFGFDLRNWSIDFDCPSRSSWSIRNWHEEEVLELSGLRLRTYLLNNYDHIFTERKHWGEYEKLPNGNWRHQRYSSFQRVESSCPFTGVCYDESFLDPIREFLKNPNGNTFAELIDECIQKIIQDGASEWEYQQSDEATIERIEANEYEFTEDGELI